MSEQVLKVRNPPIKGMVVKNWQKDIKATFAKMTIDCPIVIDGIYGEATRSYTAALCHASGLTAGKVMAEGVTPELRSKLRNQELTTNEERVKRSQSRRDYRVKLRQRWKAKKIHKLVDHITTDDWGYHPPGHDGVDICTKPDAPFYAPVKCKVIDVRASGWWGKGAPSNPDVKAKGDGIVQLEVLETVGPYKKGMHLGYGHCEKAAVKVGQIISAGTKVAHSGLANAWHSHWMVNTGNTTKGIGNVDPRPLIDYAQKHG